MRESFLLFYAIIGFVFILLIFLLALYIIRKLIKILPLNSAFGTDTKSRLLGLGVAVIFFPTVLPQIVGVLVSMFTNIVRNGSLTILEGFNKNSANCNEYNTVTCAGQIGVNLFQAISGILGNGFENLNQIPVNRLVLLLCVWAFVAYLFDQLQKNPDEAGNADNHNWAKKLFLNRGSVTVRNTVFFLILIAGAYLSIAAIAAIPQLQEKSVDYQEIGTEKLKIQLENSLSIFEKKYPLEIGNKDVFNKLEEFLKTVEVREGVEFGDGKSGKPEPEQTPKSITVEANTNNTIKPNANTTVNSNSNTGTISANTNPQTNPAANTIDNNMLKPTLTQPTAKISLPQNVINDIKYIFSGGKQGYEQAIQNYKTLLTSVKDTQRTAKDSAVQTYETSNLVGKGNKERVKYYNDITDNFNQQTNILDQRLSICLSSAQEMDNAWKSFVDTLASLKPNQSAEELIYSRSNERLYESNSRAQRDCLPYLPPSPKTLERPLLGEASELGIFGFVAGWLLRTESLSLALITGLMGFGLLGSACSTFIRERLVETRNETDEPEEKKLSERKPRGLLVSDLTAVIIRGVSAAIVVFLAVEGGLAIFAAGGGEPNPYVLLLTCLVAAVFSETIWGWAEKELNDRINKKNEPDKDDEKPIGKCKCENPKTENASADVDAEKTSAEEDKEKDENPEPK